MRHFRTSLPRKARVEEEDFYKILEIGQSANQKDIKQQFYKLSKKWHPDVNQGSEESKKKFQRVSEAYATLGSESSRKQYDQQRTFGARRGGGGGRAGMRYDSDNLQRRATATYAWDYQRRTAARAFKKANESSSSGSAKRTSDNAYRTHYQHDGGSSSSSAQEDRTMFERLAEQQRKREAAMQARHGEQNYGGDGRTKRGDTTSSMYEQGDQSSSHLVRFLQVSGLFGFIFYCSAFMSDGGSNSPAATRKRVITAGST